MSNVRHILCIAAFPCEGCGKAVERAARVPVDPDGRITQQATLDGYSQPPVCAECRASAKRDTRRRSAWRNRKPPMRLVGATP